MKMLAYLLGIICVITAVMYFVMPAGQLPAFMPGYLAGSDHIHKTHALAAAVELSTVPWTEGCEIVLVGFGERAGLGVCEQVRLVVCRQEGGAAYMADAYGKLTGRPGICFVTRGPGARSAGRSG